MPKKKYAFADEYKHQWVTLVTNTLAMRLYRPIASLMIACTRPQKDLETTSFEVAGTQGKKVKTKMFQPKGAKEALPCIIDFHGGAFCYKASPYQLNLAYLYAQNCHCKIVFPDYHLMPKYRFPHAFTDAEAVTEYVLENAESLGIRKDDIIVMGDSAGGALAAYMANRYGEKLKAEVLLYPVTEYGMDDDSMKEYTDTPCWNSKRHKKLITMYLDGADLDEINDVAPLYSPIKETIPRAYVETAYFDCLRDQGVNYAKRLKNQGVDTLFIQTQGTPHGYDMNLKTSVSKKCIESRISFINSVFESR